MPTLTELLNSSVKKTSAKSGSSLTALLEGAQPRTPVPGEPEFIGPVRPLPPLAGDPTFIGPVTKFQQAQADVRRGVVPEAPAPVPSGFRSQTTSEFGVPRRPERVVQKFPLTEAAEQRLFPPKPEKKPELRKVTLGSLTAEDIGAAFPRTLGRFQKAVAPAVEFLTPKTEREALEFGLIPGLGGKGFVDIPILATTAFGKTILSRLLRTKSAKKATNILLDNNIPRDLADTYGRLFSKTKTIKEVNRIADALENITKRTKPGAAAITKKPRGFLESVQVSKRVSPQAKKILRGLPEKQATYGVFTDREAIQLAQQRVAKSQEDAVAFVMGSNKAGKEVVATGIELMRVYRQAGNFGLEARVATNLAEKATRGGQMIQAFSLLEKLSPEGVLVLASRRIGKPGKAAVLSQELAGKLVRQAEDIQRVPKDLPYEKFLKIQELTQTIAQEVPRSKLALAKNWISELANLPRTIMSSFFDFSASFRQGLVAGIRNPKQFRTAFKAQFAPFFKEKNYVRLMNDVMTHPDFDFAVQSGVPFTDINLKLTGREEKFMSSWAEKIPGFGRVVRATNRAYTGFLNKLRMDTFSKIANDMEAMGVNVRTNEEISKRLGSFVGDMTGRGDLPVALEKAAPLLNAFFFSPRLISSRVNLLVPIKYIRSPAPIRKEYLETMLAFGSTMATILGLAKITPGVDVGLDPRSADFAKIRVGNTRIDIMAGFQQYFRIASQVISGKYISSTTGKIITLGEGFRPLTRLDILIRGVESKEAPIISFITTLLKGQTFEGGDISVPKEVVDRFTPMVLSDLIELAQEDPNLLPLGILGMFGVGLQTYGPPEQYEKLKEINDSPNPAAAFDQLAKENPKLAEKVKRVKIQEDFTEFDWGLTYMGVENGRRAAFLVEHFAKMEREEKIRVFDDLRRKKLISERVADQIKFLLANPTFEVPNG